jgi:hypothetical protein
MRTSFEWAWRPAKPKGKTANPGPSPAMSVDYGAERIAAAECRIVAPGFFVPSQAVLI